MDHAYILILMYVWVWFLGSIEVLAVVYIKEVFYKITCSFLFNKQLLITSEIIIIVTKTKVYILYTLKKYMF